LRLHHTYTRLLCGNECADAVDADYSSGADANTNFDYAINRYYISAHGRFLSPDPYRGSASPVTSGSWNRYAYTEGNPANANDPSGLDDNANFSVTVVCGRFCDGPTRKPPDLISSGHGLASGSETGASLPSISDGEGRANPYALVQFPYPIYPTGQTVLPVYTVDSKPVYTSNLQLIGEGVVNGAGCIANAGCVSQIAGAAILAGTGVGAGMTYGLFGTGTLTTLAGHRAVRDWSVAKFNIHPFYERPRLTRDNWAEPR
jgi:RHS repeat-associated protein